jgi:DNA-binding winged helix-turn-helix (wHTH) protein
MRYVFADCVLDTQRCVLSRDGRVIALRPKVFRVLWYLLTQPARVVPKHEVAAQVWPDAFTSDAVIESTIKAVRQALGDSGRTQRYIQTLRGYGYRVVVEVTVCPEAAADGDGGAAAAPEAPPLPDRTRCRVCHHPARAEAIL